MGEYTLYEKVGSRWVLRDHDPGAYYVHENLNGALIAKYIKKCAHITSIRHKKLHDGRQRITVYRRDGYKTVYILDNYPYY